ncbi:hypothetical protein PHO31112_03236 [Pandoraea horticolens]|uniref:Uncharacterized protein n=1 Tax=Pandoraea horticolens TaxID=2508298 RepID=A0A5E4WHM2_9BURK|nr:hypothetical protein PHO31112_03236 [Pandoraea horticolens]
MSEFSQADVGGALSDYRERLSDAVEFANTWHDKLR